MVRTIFSLLLISFVITSPVSAADEDAVIGEWYTKDSKALVQIYKQGDVYNGKIVWLKEPKNEDGSAKLDTNNPDEAQRGQPIIGLNLVKGFTYKGSNKWADGTIYDPDNGKTYKCKMNLNDDGSLKVRGFIGVSLIGRTQVWTRK